MLSLRAGENRPISAVSPRNGVRPLSVVHLVSSLNVGGMEQFVLRIASRQRDVGNRVSVLALRGGPLQERARSLGVPTAVLRGRSKLSRVVEAGTLLAVERPDILHPHNQTSLHYAAMGKRLTGARILMTNHGQGLGAAREPGMAEWRKTDAIVCVSDAVRNRMDTWLAEKITTIRNGVEFAPATIARAAMRSELGIPQPRCLAVIIARVDGRKGHDVLLAALEILKERSVPITVLVAGDGAERAALEQGAAQQGLIPSYVRFLGFRDDVPNLLAAADLLVLPSLSEGLPLSVLEAMSHGLPSVASDVGGIPEVILDGEQGLLVPAGAAEPLAEAMERLALCPEQRLEMGSKARIRAQSEFSFDAMVEQYDVLYRSLLH